MFERTSNNGLDDGGFAAESCLPGAPGAMASDPAKDDALILVDGLDRQTGEATKLQAHTQGLLHRAFSVVLMRDAWSIIGQKTGAVSDYALRSALSALGAPSARENHLRLGGGCATARNGAAASAPQEIVWDAIAPKPGAGEKASGARFLPAYGGAHEGLVRAA